MKVEAKIRVDHSNTEGSFQARPMTNVWIDIIIDGDASVVSALLVLRAPRESLEGMNIETDTWQELVKMVQQGTWYKRGEAGRKALDAENAKLNNRGEPA